MIIPDNNFPFTATSLNTNNFSVPLIHTAYKVASGHTYDTNISISSLEGLHTCSTTALDVCEVAVNHGMFLSKISLRNNVSLL